MSDLLVVTGPPGAGKSTVTAILAQRCEPCALVAGDDFFQMITRGLIAPWTAAAHEQNIAVVGASAAAAGRLAGGGLHVVFDGLIGPWFLDDFFTATGLDRIDYALLLPPEEICVERVANRTGHGLTDLDATRHMYREFASAPVGDRHVIATVAEPETLAVAIAERAAAGGLSWPARR